MKKADRIISLIVIIFFSVVYYLSLNFPTKAAKYPRLIASLGILIASLILIKTFIKKDNKQKESENKPSKEEIRENKEKNKIILVTIIVTALYVILMPVLGYVISTLLFVITLMWRLDKEHKISLKYVIISTVVTIFMFVLFRNFLGVMLPEGILF